MAVDAHSTRLLVTLVVVGNKSEQWTLLNLLMPFHTHPYILNIQHISSPSNNQPNTYSVENFHTISYNFFELSALMI